MKTETIPSFWRSCLTRQTHDTLQTKVQVFTLLWQRTALSVLGKAYEQSQSELWTMVLSLLMWKAEVLYVWLSE